MSQVQGGPRGDVRWDEYPESELLPVLRHARDAFVANGYNGTTVRDIASRMGQTVPAIYYYYENKQALLVALLHRSMDDLLERCRLAQLETRDDPAEQLTVLVRCIVLYVAHRREMAFLDAEIRSLEPANREAYVFKRDQMQAMITRVITIGMERSVFSPGDPHSDARALIMMLRGIANWYRPGGHLGPEDLCRQYVTYALRLVGHQPV
ncbi:TetR/AcrR family transcriptional regulator [Saccharopolyspora sp. ASAGF58]|uniref:TetR/AcrR family transcriptional regulator n=1 Tax=Saccharopolyspora sp. ASAGF58 TaxID=2719023 RepID=UPI0014484D0A|nr:TetR/AcrR family transcriptional regulator [Saccharopolyspora sp. ASAGF58]